MCKSNPLLALDRRQVRAPDIVSTEGRKKNLLSLPGIESHALSPYPITIITELTRPFSIAAMFITPGDYIKINIYII
jgi:hypothetical protein